MNRRRRKKACASMVWALTKKARAYRPMGTIARAAPAYPAKGRIAAPPDASDSHEWIDPSQDSAPNGGFGGDFAHGVVQKGTGGAGVLVGERGAETGCRGQADKARGGVMIPGEGFEGEVGAP